MNNPPTKKSYNKVCKVSSIIEQTLHVFFVVGGEETAHIEALPVRCLKLKQIVQLLSWFLGSCL